MARLAAAYRHAHPLPVPERAAGSFPIASFINGAPAIKTLAWFPSIGCWWSLSGGCTFCDFGTVPHPGSAQEIVDAFRAHLAQLDPGLQHLHLAPVGSFFSDRETTAEVRRGVVEATAVFPFMRSLGFETRPEELTAAKLTETLAVVPPSVRDVYVGFGLEARSELVRDVIVNKGYTLQQVLDAQQVIAAVNAAQGAVRVHAEAYVMIKPMFLSEAEGIEEALRTVQWCYANGIDTAVLFLNTVKQATLQHLAWSTETLEEPLRFQPPYFRSAVEVLRRLPADERHRTVVLGVQSGVLADGQPRGCALCRPVLLGALMGHNFTREPALLEHAAACHCPCRDDWLAEIERPPPMPLVDRVDAGITALERLI
jgi:radical SAM enzyme (TIGR01210 family)